MKNRTFFEIVTSQPSKPFAVGDEGLLFNEVNGFVFGKVIEVNDSKCPITFIFLKDKVISLTENGARFSGGMRLLFTLDEAREMGITPSIPHLGVVVCWDKDHTSGRSFRFWDNDRKTNLSIHGEIGAVKFGNHRHIPDETALLVWPEMLEAREALRVKLENK